MAGADTQKTSEEDQSMEEILQSIRRIIAEDDSDDSGEGEADKVTGDSNNEDKLDAAETETKEDGAMEEKQEEAPGSDVLELTEVVEDGTDEPAENSDQEQESQEEPAKEAEIEPAAATKEDDSADVDVLANIDAALGSGEQESAGDESAADAQDDTSLLSAETATAAAQVLKAVKTSKSDNNLSFRSGTTIEDLVLEAMKPMLKEWLDSNLTSLVERVVEREIKKLSE